MGQLQGKVAFITGGASGIGASSARALAREGAAVIVSDINGERAADLAASITRDGHLAMGIAQDVTDENGWPQAIRAAEERFGPLDVMVANAGVCVMGLVTEMSLAEWRRQNAINVDGVFLSVKYAIPAMRSAGGGSIVIMSSAAGFRGSAGFAGYCASKGAVRLFAKAVALECAGAGDNIRVNSLHPGVIDTPLWGTIPVGERGIDPQRMSHNEVPMGRPGTADEVAASVVFLASDASSYITGTELILDGGINAGVMPKRRG